MDFAEEYGRRSLLRFTTVGSVDDGKSTLIGRLLHDSRNVLVDQLEAIETATKKRSDQEGPDLSLLTDGLRAEREQGITIDVAYRYFSTAKRNFIIADTPGHEQYTRNMATGASTAHLAVILVDAEHGLTTQTRRHAFIASLLGIPRLLVAVNKMDLVSYAKERFEEIREDFEEFAKRLGIVSLQFIPVSALRGDNIVERSKHMDWYEGRTVLDHLENVYVDSDANVVDFRFPVSFVLRPSADRRLFAGQVASGRVSPGDEVMVLPSRQRSRVRSVWLANDELKEAVTPQSVAIELEDDVDIVRGDMIARVNNLPFVDHRVEAMLVWLGDRPLDMNCNYFMQHTTRETRATVSSLSYRVDVNTLGRTSADTLNMNEIGRVAFDTRQEIFFDAYERNRTTGAFILIDPEDNATVAAGTIIQRVPPGVLPTQVPDDADRNIYTHDSLVTRAERERRLDQTGTVFWFTGLSGSGKSTIAAAFERRLFDMGRFVVRLDGDNLRTGLNSNLGFSEEDRHENVRRTAEAAKLLAEQGFIVITSMISPFRAGRMAASEIVGSQMHVIHVNTSLEVCEARDTKGLYKKARAGEIVGFTGVDAPYEAPESPRLRLDSNEVSLTDSVSQLLKILDP